MERYTYLALFIKHFMGCLSIFLGPAFIGAGVYTLDKGGWFLIPMGVFATWLMIAAEKSFFERNRPLEIDETGVCAMAFGRIWKSIAWTDVQRIEQIRTTIYTPLKFRYGYEFVIVGAHEQIKLDDTIRRLPAYDKFPAIVDTLNFYVQRHHIPLVAYDKGEDTQAHTKATVKDKQMRKKLLQEGVRTSITSLQSTLPIASTTR